MQQRFTFVDGLRGRAALAVVLFHAGEGQHIGHLLAELPPWFREGIGKGYLGVPVFFVLSGFVIAHTLFEKPMTLRSFGHFTLGRSLRLDPPYWAAIAATIAFATVASIMVTGRQTEVYSVQQLAAHVLYLQEITGHRKINSVFWTLCLEIQFYLVYAGLLWLAGSEPSRPHQGRRIAAILIGAGFISLLWPLGLGPSLHYALFPPLWHGFLLGAGAYWAARKRQLDPGSFYTQARSGSRLSQQAMSSRRPALQRRLFYLPRW